MKGKRRDLSGKAALLAALGVLGIAALRRARRRSQAGEVALVTGGSRGLGLLLAMQLLKEGFKVAICARDQEELSQAKAILTESSPGASVITRTCDVTDKDQILSLFSFVESEWGAVDLLINNAGLITVGPIKNMVKQDFTEAMEIYFWAPFHTIERALPNMLEKGSGRIINISSIGGRVPVLHLAPYCSAKFALTGLSMCFAQELSQYGISVTTVCPGLMRTGSHRNAWFKGQNKLEYALFSSLNSLPPFSINAERAARMIVRAGLQRRSYLTYPATAFLYERFANLFPGLSLELMKLLSRLLPDDGKKVPVRGFESKGAAPSIFTALSDRASKRNNEMMVARGDGHLT